MGLYLCIFDADEDIDGVDAGFYSDFGAFRETVSSTLESGQPGRRFPTLILHSDCDGQWTAEECRQLELELVAIHNAFVDLPPQAFSSDWQIDLAKKIGLRPSNLAESFIDVDGEPLIGRLIELARASMDRNLPVLFQ